MDPFTPAQDAIYTALGVSATITGLEAPGLLVIDKTAGVDIEGTTGRGAPLPTLLPAAVARRAQLPVERLADLIGRRITFNGKEWGITTYKPKPSPRGEALGEVYLVLREQ